jgi:subtilisin family serine protease
MPEQFVPLPGEPDVPGPDGSGTGFTGRFLVAFEPGTAELGVSELQNRAGIAAFSARGGAPASSNVVLEEIGVAIVDAPPDQQSALRVAAADVDSPIRVVEPERYVWAAIAPDLPEAPTASAPRPSAPDTRGARALSVDFLRGYSAAASGLLAALDAQTQPAGSDGGAQAALASSATWGLVATRVPQSAFSGRGIRVAVLDTGFEQQHPDFAGRVIITQSFVPGEAVQDLHGHGTHCIGTSCGPLNPPLGVRYGVAYGAEIYVGKVLNNAGRGTDGQMLAGINWAVQNQCAVVSMSIGAPVQLNQPYNRVFQAAANAAVERGTLIVVAAGNDSARPGVMMPVSHPANCPSLVAVAALDVSSSVASFSNAGLNSPGGEVNVAGPGVGIYSTWTLPSRYNTISGTSMATPHVAGIAALYAEATGLRGMPLANALLRRSQRLAPIRDFGWGLVQAP